MGTPAEDGEAERSAVGPPSAPERDGAMGTPMALSRFAPLGEPRGSVEAAAERGSVWGGKRTWRARMMRR